MNRAAHEFLSGDTRATEPLLCFEVSHHRETPCSGSEHPCPLVQTPVCYPILDAPARAKLTRDEIELTRRADHELMAPSKTFNIPGLHCSFATVQNRELREKLEATGKDLVPEVNILGYTAALAAYRDGKPWLEEVLRYLEANLDFLVLYVEKYLPGITMTRPEGTYLAWLNCQEAGIPDNPHQFFLQARFSWLAGGSRSTMET